MKSSIFYLTFFFTILAGSTEAQISDLQKKVEASLVPYAKTLASNPIIVDAVTAANSERSKPKMDNETWKKIAVSDPFVQRLMTNSAAKELEAKKLAFVSEVFISAADGTKVAFLEKTSSWSHKGKPKHDLPMNGKNWVGKIELDESSGVNQIQVSVPIMVNGRPIGSVVVGAAVTKL